MSIIFHYIRIAKNYPTEYEGSHYVFQHLDVKGSCGEIGSWDCGYAEFFQLGIL